MAEDNQETKPRIVSGFIAPIRADKLRLGGLTNAVSLVDTRCRRCNKLLFRGALKGEIKCPKCGLKSEW